MSPTFLGVPAERIVLKAGDELTADLLEQVREQAMREEDANVWMLVRFIEARRDDHTARLLFSRLLGKHALSFARAMRALDFLTEPETIGRRMYVGMIDNFINDWKEWIEGEPPSFEPDNVTKEFSPDGATMHAKYVHWTASVVGAMLAESLIRPHNDPENDRHIYFNNVTMTMTHHGQRFAVTLQRCDGETPAQQRAKAEAERDRALTAARLLREDLADMVNQHGGEETCLSANESAVDTLEQTKWLDEVRP